MASFYALPFEIVELIAMNLGLADYLRFRAICQTTWRTFGCKTLIHLLDGITRHDGKNLEEGIADCRYISRGHVLLYAFRKNGISRGLDILVQNGASLKHVPCGDIIEREAQSFDFETRLGWLIQHGASYHEVRGGVNKLLFDASFRDRKRLIWLLRNGASPEQTVDPANRTMEALRAKAARIRVNRGNKRIVTDLPGTNRLWGRNLLMGHREPTDLSVIRSRAAPYTLDTPGIQGKRET
jgi:hypothetical protein